MPHGVRLHMVEDELSFERLADLVQGPRVRAAIERPEEAGDAGSFVADSVEQDDLLANDAGDLGGE